MNTTNFRTGGAAAVQYRGLDHHDDLQTLTLDEVGRLYGISRRSLSKYIAQGRLRAIQVGRHKQVTVAALREFLALPAIPG